MGFWEKIPKTSVKEVVSGIIALLLIGPSVFIINYIILTNPSDITAAQAIVELLGPWIGIVLGFYFGVSSGESAAKRAEEKAQQDIDRLKDKVRQATDLPALQKTI